jgi:DNA replication and repair protein RecF
VQIRWLQIVDFRNYRSLAYRPSPTLNLLSGPNAQGKTNLLEALAVLLAGRSFRTSRLADLPRWGAASATVVGEVSRGDGGRTLRRELRQTEPGVWQTVGEACEWARVVAFSWQDVEILSGPPAGRRSFVDGFAGRLYASHIPALLRYRRVLARRVALLQAGQAESLGPWDEQLAMLGTELSSRRRAAVAQLQAEVSRIFPELCGEERKVELRYRSSLPEGTDVGGFVAALERLRGQEVRRRQTLVGPHRDDVVVEIDGVDARVFGSRGQQRLLALALRLAELTPITGATGTAPVLLLDDPLSELEPAVQARVLRESGGAGGQVFLTTADPSVPAEGAMRWDVREGALVAA